MKTKIDAKRIVSEDNLNIYYWINSPSKFEKSRGFFFLHPASSMNHSSLEKLENKLIDDGFSTIILDPRGVGLSDKPFMSSDYNLELFSSDIRKVLEQEGVEKPMYFTHSMGFMPVVDYVYKTNNAEQIFGSGSSHKFKESSPNRLLFWLFDKYIRKFEVVMQSSIKKRKGISQYNDLSNATTEIDLYEAICDVPEEEIEAHIVSGRKINTWGISYQLSEINIPIHLIYGNKDEMVRYKKTAPHIKDVSGGIVTLDLVAGGKHALPLFQPKKVVEIMQKYI